MGWEGKPELEICIIKGATWVNTTRDTLGWASVVLNLQMSEVDVVDRDRATEMIYSY